MIPGKDYTPGFETEEKINQCEHDSNRWFPNNNHDLAFLTLCLAGEVGELANKVKKVERGSTLIQTPKTLQEIVEEINDIRVYLYNVMGLHTFDDVNWEDEWNRKRTFNEDRFGPKGSTYSSPTGRMPEAPKRFQDLPPRTIAKLSLPKQVLAEAGEPVGDVTQTWQTPGEFAS